MFYAAQERMLELRDTQKGAEMACEASERELELEAQLVEARSIIQEQVWSLTNFQACMKHLCYCDIVKALIALLFLTIISGIYHE